MEKMNLGSMRYEAYSIFKNILPERVEIQAGQVETAGKSGFLNQS